MKPIIAAILGAFALTAAPAEEGRGLLKHAVNKPGVTWSSYGPAQDSSIIRDPQVQGGQALRIRIWKAGPHAYTNGAIAPVDKPIRKGDRIVIIFWARAPQLAEGSVLQIPYLGLARTEAPYRQIVRGDATLTRQWKLFEIRGAADEDLPGGAANISTHLSAARGPIDLGPLFVLAFTPGTTAEAAR